MASVNERSMHADHSEDKYDHLLWLEEIEHWRVERRWATGMLASIAAAWQAAEETLESHVEAIRAHQAQVLEHELAITEHQRNDIEPSEDRLAVDHAEFNAAHARQREVHEKIRSQHVGMVTEIRELYRAACQICLVPECSSSLDD